jgi:hypothetical protein
MLIDIESGFASYVVLFGMDSTSISLELAQSYLGNITGEDFDSPLQ